MDHREYLAMHALGVYASYLVETRENMKHGLVEFSTIGEPLIAVELRWLGTSRFDLEEPASGPNGSNMSHHLPETQSSYLQNSCLQATSTYKKN